MVIVGGGRAAAAAAVTLRGEGFEGEVVVVGEEPHAPYERPPLSKGWAAPPSAEDLLLRERDWYADHDVRLLTGVRADHLDVADRRLRLSDGGRLGYDRLLLATGGRPRRLPGVTSERVRYLRTLDDARALQELAASGEALVVLGGGFIGCEVAAAARAAGVDVTVLEMQPTLLRRALDPQLGEIVEDVHRDRGVTVRTGERVESVEEITGGLLVRTDRATLECSALLVAVGMARATELLDGTPVACDDGVLVDEHAETGVPGVFAAGDVAATWEPRLGRRLRLEHDDNAAKQGALAARNMLGGRVVHEAPHWFWSDQYEHSIQMAGLPDGHDEVVLRGTPEDRSFCVFWLQAGHVVAMLAFDRGREMVAGRKLVAARAEVSAAQLKDESVELRRLLRPRREGAS
jgi:3-phenylpropionate/trans-cinnamate dioxygenase ferredoxin reductase subunit